MTEHAVGPRRRIKTPVAFKYSLTKPLETIAGHQIDVRSIAKVRHAPACRGCIGSSGCLSICPSATNRECTSARGSMKLGRVMTSRTSLGSCSLWKAVTHPSQLHLCHLAVVVSDRPYASCRPVRELCGGRQLGGCQYKSSPRIPSLVPLSLACPMAHPQRKGSHNRLLMAHLQASVLHSSKTPAFQIMNSLEQATPCPLPAEDTAASWKPTKLSLGRQLNLSWEIPLQVTCHLGIGRAVQSCKGHGKSIISYAC